MEVLCRYVPLFASLDGRAAAQPEERTGDVSDMPDLERLADLVRAKNDADAAIAGLIGRPSAPGNIGEFVAARVFAIHLMASGAHHGYDGLFTDGPLAGKTVNIKTYSRYESVLDISPHPCDYYLVLADAACRLGPDEAVVCSQAAEAGQCRGQADEACRGSPKYLIRG